MGHLTCFTRRMDGIRLRHAGVADAEPVAHVHRLSRAWYYGTEADPDDGREVMWSRLMAEPERVFLLAEAAVGAIGFVSWTRAATPIPALELTSLYVLPEHAGTGVGSRLYEHFECERRDDEAGVLEVWEGNARAIAFYVRRGWSPTPERRPGPENVDFVSYRLAARQAPG